MQTSRRDTARSLGLLLAMLAALVVARWSLAGGLDQPVAPPVVTLSAARPVPPSGEVVPELRGTWLYLSGRQPAAVDAGSGELRRLPGSGRRTTVLRHGQYLVALTSDERTDNQRMITWYDGTGSRVAVLDRAGRSRPLGGAISLLPSPRPDRVWLASQPSDSAARTYRVEEVALADGRRLASSTLPYDATPVAVLDQGMLVRDLHGGLAVRDLATGKVRQRFGTGLTLVDAQASRVAYLDQDARLHLRDLATGRHRVVAPPAEEASWLALGPPLLGSACCGPLGAFAPDGHRLAVFVQADGPGGPALAMVDVDRATAAVVAGSGGATPLSCLPCLGWSSTGWLFFFVGTPAPGAVAAWRPDRPRASRLALDLDVGSVFPAGVTAS
jgi:hypothetical protein